MKKKNLFIAILMLLACSVFAQAETDKAVTRTTEKKEYNLPEVVLPLWNSLTIQQKIAQMIMVYIPFSHHEKLIQNEFGAIIVGSFQNWETAQKHFNIIKSVQKEISINSLVAIDQEGGLVNRLRNISAQWNKTPSAQEMSLMSEKQVFELAKGIGKTLYDIGINVNLAPDLDPKKDENGQENLMHKQKRCWGEENANKVQAFIKGMNENGIVCASKHFPGYDSKSNSDTEDATSTTSLKGVSRNIRFFKKFKKDIPITMMSSIRYTSISDTPALFDPQIVGMARKMSPETVILTDALEGNTIQSWISNKFYAKSKKVSSNKLNQKLIHLAIDAGNDMFMFNKMDDAEKIIDYLTELCERDSSYLHRIETSAARILKMKYNTGILKKDKLTPNRKHHRHPRPKLSTEPKPWADYARP